MNLREIKDLINLMNEHGLSEIELESGETKIKLKRPGSNQIEENVMSRPQALPQPKNPAPAAEAVPVVKPGHVIKSPMVGTFYAAPAPDADPFCTVGGKVEVGQVVCIIEAMKLMNEIKSEIKGVITEIHVTNGQPVEFGQPLYTVA